jgi:hypothetical protein
MTKDGNKAPGSEEVEREGAEGDKAWAGRQKKKGDHEKATGNSIRKIVGGRHTYRNSSCTSSRKLMRFSATK